MPDWRVLLPLKLETSDLSLKKAWDRLLEVLRQIWQQLSYLEGRNGPVTLRSDLIVEGVVSDQSPEPSVISITATPYYVPSDTLVTWILADTTLHSIDVYLPDLPASGRHVWVRKTSGDGNVITVYGQSNSLVDGASSTTVDGGTPQKGFVLGDDLNWWVFSN